MRRNAVGTAQPRLGDAYRTSSRTRTRSLGWRGQLTFLLVFGLAGVAISGVFSGVLEVHRDLFVLLYLLVASPLIYAYYRAARLDVGGAVLRHWHWGILGALAAGAFVVVNVLGQETSPREDGLTLARDLVWLGGVYGLLDAVFLSILPISMAWLAAKDLGLTGRWSGRIVAAVMALSASLFVTAMYHWGFTEFRGADVGSPVFGNGILSLSYLLTGNPLASALSHVAMHVASVLQGMETTLQLPPH